MASVTVITPSMPERAAMLAEAQASVAAQTARPVAHLIAVDYEGAGPAALRNQLLDAADTEWVAFLDDDDVLDPHHLAVLAVHADGADVVYSWCRVEGRALGARFHNRHYDRDALREHGIFPITVLARRDVLLAAGGFDEEARYEDWALWNRVADDDGRFVCVPEVTWTYRFAGGNRTDG